MEMIWSVNLQDRSVSEQRDGSKRGNGRVKERKWKGQGRRELVLEVRSVKWRGGQD